MNKKIEKVLVILFVASFITVPLVGSAQACRWENWRKQLGLWLAHGTETDMGDYTEYIGTLGRANLVVRIPDEWNGMLVVGCHGYMQLDWNPDAQFQVDNLVDGEGIGIPFALIEQGFAYAASSYGEGGFSVKMGMIRTHQLTKWAIFTFGADEVFIIGHSMGGTIGLLLGEKYPELYDGVLDISGMKDVILGYTELVALISGPIFPTLPLPKQAMFLQMKADMEAEYGGTYEEKPKAYERRNPTSNAEISIPTITVNGALDPLTSPAQAVSYEIAVAEAGCSEYYRLYTVAGGAHGDPPTIGEALSHFEKLVNYPSGW